MARYHRKVGATANAMRLARITLLCMLLTMEMNNAFSRAEGKLYMTYLYNKLV